MGYGIEILTLAGLNYVLVGVGGVCGCILYEGKLFMVISIFFYYERRLIKSCQRR